MSAAEYGLSDLGPVELDGFEVWDRTVQAPAGQGKKVAFVSLRVGGIIGMNNAARQMLGSAQAVKVMFDKTRQRIGIMPSDPDDANSYDIHERRGAQIPCKKFFEHYGITVTKSKRYQDLQVIDGILIVDIGK